MHELSNVPAYLVSLVIELTPGPNMVYFISRSIYQSEWPSWFL